jgi:hypothetical protein
MFSLLLWSGKSSTLAQTVQLCQLHERAGEAQLARPLAWSSYVPLPRLSPKSDPLSSINDIQSLGLEICDASAHGYWAPS